MKVLIVTTVFNTVNEFLIPHIEALKKEGHEIDIATSNAENLEKPVFTLCRNVINVNFNRKPISLDNYISYLMMKELLKKEKYDIIHTHTPIASFITRLASSRLINNNTKIYYTAHGFHFYEGAPIKNWIIFYPIEKYLSKKTNVLITINDEDYTIAQNKNFKSEKIEKISGVGIDLTQYGPNKVSICYKNNLKQNLGIRNNELVLTYVAELNDNKNQILLFDTLKVITQYREVKLLLVGDGINYEKYHQFVIDNKLSGNCLLLGYRSDILELLSITDIYVASSLREGLPVNIMEAMAMGLPIVALDNRGHRELIVDGLNGFIISKENPNEFAMKIMKIINDEVLYNSMSRNSLSMIKNYSLEVVLKQLRKVYR